MMNFLSGSSYFVEKEKVFFMLEGEAPPEDLIRMAESISVEQ